MLLHVVHRTVFHYAGQAHDSFNEVRLKPADDLWQSCRRFALRIDPDASIRDYQDFYGNTVHYFDVGEGHKRLVVEADSTVETAAAASRPPMPAVPREALGAMGERELMSEFFAASPYVPLEVELWREAQDVLTAGRSDVWTDVQRLGRHVHRTFAYRAGVTGVDTRATDVLRIRAGVCQDFAHVMIGLCRSDGLPARYVSGYFLNTHRRPGEIEASHAWMEVHLPGHGWAAYDPTHDRPADERYVKVAAGRDYSDIRPISGTYRGAPTRQLEVEVSVRPASLAAPDARPA